MILVILSNTEREQLQQAREIARHRWPNESLEFRNTDWIEGGGLETAGVTAVITTTRRGKLVQAYREAGIRVLLIPERNTWRVRDRARRQANPELAFVPEADPALVKVLLAIPENKLISLVPCLRSLPVVAAMLNASQQSRKSSAVQIALTRRLCQLRGVIE